MHDDWLPISDYPLPEFDAKHWYRSGPRVLVWSGGCTIASYDYTKKGKGRWRDWGGTVRPTHWMALPGNPTH